MGGRGSTRWRHYTKKMTVNQVSSLDIRDVIIKNMASSGTHHWQMASDYAIEMHIGSEHAWIAILFKPTRTRGSLYQRIDLQTSTPYFGGIRWYFTCPRCARRVSKLYLPLRALQYACRLCYALTYQSCQESHKYDRIYRELATTLPPAAVAYLRRL